MLKLLLRAAIILLVASLALLTVEPYVASYLNIVSQSLQTSKPSGTTSGTSLQTTVTFTAEAIIYKYGWYPIYLPFGLYMIWMAQALFVGALIVFTSLFLLRLGGRLD